MHIAILFYGRINNYDKHYNNIINNITKNVDTFDIFYSCDQAPYEDINKFNNLYKPLGVCNEKIEYTHDLNMYGHNPGVSNKHNMLCHFINKQRVYNLLEKHISLTNKVYDFVISTRLDIVYLNEINFNTFDNNLHIPLHADWLGGINDQIAIGSIENMKIYMNIYSNIIHLLETRKSIVHPESLFKAHLENVIIKRFPLNYNICR
jgi:hypothetical protein